MRQIWCAREASWGRVFAVDLGIGSLHTSQYSGVAGAGAGAGPVVGGGGIMS